MPTLKERLDQANQMSVQLYLRRQQIENQKMQILRAASDCDQELIRLDGELRLLEQLVKDEVVPEAIPSVTNAPSARRGRKPRLVEAVG